MMRKGAVARNTKETQISVAIELDGTGKASVDTGIPFMDHMLNLFAKHGLFDLEVKASGDLEIDCHHTMEDLGITMGEAIAEAVGNKAGISRYGFSLLPMDETLAEVALDLSGRACLVYQVEPEAQYIKDLDVTLFREFFRALSSSAAMNLHVHMRETGETHHVFEAVFKGFARALSAAVTVDPRRNGEIPTTKGML